jgi:hypothetical protein
MAQAAKLACPMRRADATINVVRQKVLAMSELAANMLVHLPPMTKQITGKALANKAAKAAATDTVRRKVFAILELVENILVHLPPKTIFGVMRVCKAFANALIGSLQIQEKLHVRQRIKIDETMVHGDQHSGLALNPFFIGGTGVRLDIDRHLDKRNGIAIRDGAFPVFESSVFDAYLFDIPCGRIQLRFEIHAAAGWQISMDVLVVDSGGTIADLLESALFQPSRLIVMEGFEQVYERPRHCSPMTILRRWGYEDDWRQGIHVRLSNGV